MITDLAFLRLHRCDRDTPVSLRIFDEHGAVSTSHSIPLGDVGGLIGARRLIACIPGSESLFLTIALPPMSKRRVREALPFAVEDRLLDDVSAVHLAMGAVQSGQDGHRVDVEVIARERLTNWCELLESASLQPSALCVDAAALPVEQQDRLWFDGAYLHLRAASGERCSLGIEDWPALLDRLRESRQSPWGWVATQERDSALSLWRAAGFDPARLEPLTASDLLVQRFIDGGAINLLQGDFASRAAPAVGFTWRDWRVAAVLLLSVLLVQLLGEILQGQRLRAREDAQSAETTGVLGSASMSMSPTLEALGVIARSRPSASLMRVSAEKLQLVVEFAAGNSNDATTLIAALRAAGWTEQSEALPDGGLRLTMQPIETGRADIEQQPGPGLGPDRLASALRDTGLESSVIIGRSDQNHLILTLNEADFDAVLNALAIAASGSLVAAELRAAGDGKVDGTMTLSASI